MTKLTNLDSMVMLEFIQIAYKDQAEWEEKQNELSLDFGLGLVGDFVPDSLTRTLSDGLDRASEKSGVNLNVVDMITQDAGLAKMEELEKIEDQDVLAFNFFGLLRQIHDDSNPDPRNPKDFVASTLKQWEDHQTHSARESKRNLGAFVASLIIALIHCNKRVHLF